MKLSHQIRIAQFANTIGADIETDVDALIRAVEAIEKRADDAVAAMQRTGQDIARFHRRAQAAESEVARLRATDVGTLKARLDGALAAFEPWKRRAVKAEAEVRYLEQRQCASGLSQDQKAEYRRQYVAHWPADRGPAIL